MTAFVEFPKGGHNFSPSEVGQALAGLVARGSDGLPKRGMLAAPVVGAVAASWNVQVGRFVYVDHESGAVSFSGLSDAEQVAVDPATAIPAGQGRIDVVCWDPAASALSVVEGTVAAAPVAPSTGSLVPVVRVRVDSGDGALVASKVTRVFESTQVGDVIEVPFAWDTSKVTVVRSKFEVSGRWARLRFYVKRRSGSWANGDRLGSVDAVYAPEFVEFAPVSVTPVGPVGNLRMSTAGQLDLYTTSGTDVLGDFEWPF